MSKHEARSHSPSKFCLFGFYTLFFSSLGQSPCVLGATPAPRLNVLFISVDDLRPELGAYGVHEIQTPNIDRLAEQGTRFTRAYAQMATCSPSRTSVMTGLRPDTTRVTDLKTHFRDTVPSVVTLPEYFQQYGYEAQGICKVYHVQHDDSQSWSIPYTDYFGPFPNPTGPKGKILPYAAIDKPENAFTDGMCADAAMDALQNLNGKPFFLAVGFKKPHLPFFAPPAYFDMYDPVAIPAASNPFRAVGAPDFAFDDSSEIRSYSRIPSDGRPFSTNLRRGLKRGYYAATSFVDAQIGRLLSELERLGLANETLVVLWGDHGWHLGEQDEWGKHTNFEVGTRVPLIIRVPGKQSRQTSTEIVELVDLFPTISELAGLPIPYAKQHGGYRLEGDSFAGLMDDPLMPTKRGAISQWIKGEHVGRSIRTDRYRFTEWVNGNNSKVYELYDHQLDPSETVNVISDPGYSSLIPDLKLALARGGRRDLPPSLLSDAPLNGCGAPSYNPASEPAIHVWENCVAPDGRRSWSVSASGGGSRTAVDYKGTVTSSGALTSVGEELGSLETADLLDKVRSRRITYQLSVKSSGRDQFGFDSADGESVCFGADLPSGVPVRFGPQGALVSAPFDLTTLGICDLSPPWNTCGAPSYDPATETSVRIWENCDAPAGRSSWSALVSAGGSLRTITFEGTITSSAALSDVRSELNSIDASDLLRQSGPGEIDYRLKVGSPWFDQLGFDSVDGATVCFGVDLPGNVPIHFGPEGILVSPPVSLPDLEPCI